MKSSVPESAKWRSSKTRTTGAVLGDALEERAPCAEQLVRRRRSRLQPEQRQQRGLDPLAFGRVGRRTRRPSRAPWFARGRPRRRSRPGRHALADHLAQRPERDALAIGRRPAAVPVRVSTSPSMYLRNSHASRLLPMPAGPMTDTSRSRALAPVAWNRSLSRRSSSSRPTNGASRRLRAVPPADARPRHAARARPAPAPLALERLLAGRLERDGAAGRALGRLAHEDRSRAAATDWRRAAVLTRSPATMPWFDRADRDGRLAGQDAGARLDARTEDADRVDQLERGADGPLGVVLVGGRRSPHRHDRVTDELLDRAAVAVDHLARPGRSSGSACRARLRRRAPRRTA